MNAPKDPQAPRPKSTRFDDLPVGPIVPFDPSWDAGPRVPRAELPIVPMPMAAIIQSRASTALFSTRETPRHFSARSPIALEQKSLGITSSPGLKKLSLSIRMVSHMMDVWKT